MPNIAALICLVIFSYVVNGNVTTAENGNTSQMANFTTIKPKIMVHKTMRSYYFLLVKHLLLQFEIEFVLRGISLCCAFLTLLLMFSLRLLPSMKIFLHKQLLAAYCITNVFTLMNEKSVYYKATNNEALCTAMSISCHYFQIALYTCMLIEGIELCIKLTDVFESFSKKKKYILYGCVGWGIPFLIMVVEISIWHERFKHAQRCSILHGPYIWLFKGPVAAILGANMMCFIFIMYVVIRQICAEGRYNGKIMKLVRTVRSVLVIYPLLGFSFVFGYFLRFDPISMGYIFAVLNGMLGVLFFIFHALLDIQIRKRFLREVFDIRDSDGISRSRCRTNRMTMNTDSNVSNKRSVDQQGHLDARNSLGNKVSPKTSPSSTLRSSCSLRVEDAVDIAMNNNEMTNCPHSSNIDGREKVCNRAPTSSAARNEILIQQYFDEFTKLDSETSSLASEKENRSQLSVKSIASRDDSYEILKQDNLSAEGTIFSTKF